jgi:Cof subfamily protein (haloacid dehalogenase superfamily)
MIQYIASDLDGTLLEDGGNHIDPEIFGLILKLKEQGIHFIAASGRQYQSMRFLFQPIKDEISYITENGSLCIHGGKVIFRGEINRELGLRIIDAGKEYKNCHTLLSCESKHYTDSKNPDFIHHMRDVIQNDIAIVDDLHQVEEPFLKLAICDFNGTEQLEPFLKERFSSEIRVVTAGRIWVDFLAPNADKGKALSLLLKHLGILPEHGIAFGDQHNDIEMLQLTGTGYAMATAAPGVAEYADKVTESVKEVLKNILKGA